MKQRLSSTWKNTPARIRRPIVLIAGLFFIVLAGSIGWLPGPGGIPLFLLGIAILSSEFHWAQRLKVMILALVRDTGVQIRRHPLIACLFLIIGILLCGVILYMLFYSR